MRYPRSRDRWLGGSQDGGDWSWADENVRKSLLSDCLFRRNAKTNAKKVKRCHTTTRADMNTFEDVLDSPGCHLYNVCKYVANEAELRDLERETWSEQPSCGLMMSFMFREYWILENRWFETPNFDVARKKTQTLIKCHTTTMRSWEQCLVSLESWASKLSKMAKYVENGCLVVSVERQTCFAKPKCDPYFSPSR